MRRFGAGDRAQGLALRVAHGEGVRGDIVVDPAPQWHKAQKPLRGDALYHETHLIRVGVQQDERAVPGVFGAGGVEVLHAVPLRVYPFGQV